MTFQEIVLALERFWTERGCVVAQPYSSEVGAGTFNPSTFLRILGPEPWKVAYVEPSRRPKDGRYGKNPNRMQQFYQYQVVLKPSPDDVLDTYFDSLVTMGIDPGAHDVRLVEDDWESPTLGAWGLGWEVWVDGMEITQFTYMQQAGGIDLSPISAEITYGLERIAMFVQGVSSFNEIEWSPGLKWKDVFLDGEIEYCKYNFSEAGVSFHEDLFSSLEAEVPRLLQAGLILPAYDYVIKCSHAFNILDARGAISVAERTGYIARVRKLARKVALAYVSRREELGYPLDGRAGKPSGAGPGGGGPVRRGRETAPARDEAAKTVPQGAGSSDLLVEIGVEELPARFMRPALDGLKSIVESGLADARLGFDSVRVLGTPRRLALIVSALDHRQRDRVSTAVGPPRKVAFDADGAPTKAALGFARGAGVDVGELKVKRTEKGEYLYAEVEEKGAPAMEVLPGAIASWIEKLGFPKTMVWNEDGTRFARPIRRLLVLLGDRAVPVEAAGVVSGRSTRGHRFLGDEIEIPSAGDYVELLRKAGVVVDQGERRAAIEEGLARESARLGGRVVKDEGLLEEVTFLVELPTVVAGGFDPSHTDMPRDVVVTAMREHQRYFAVERDDGSLLPSFLTVLNTSHEAVPVSIKGNERVLEARLADARFYWDLDLGKKFDDLLEGLKGVVWHADFGTLFDKSLRLKDLASVMAERWCPDEKHLVERAALVCKADLASDMVKDGKEFTGLQGAIGGEYALRWGENPVVAEAIREHYLPRFAGDSLPDSIGAAVVGIADRVDNIVGGFAAGRAPTGSEDPYALRRAANGIIRILLEKELHVSMVDLFQLSFEQVRSYVDGGEGLLRDIFDFWVSRGDSYFSDRGIPYDIADAVLCVSFDDPVDSWNRCLALGGFREEESFSALVIGFKRAGNILRGTQEGLDVEIDPGALAQGAERRLFEKADRAQGEVAAAVAAGDYERAIEIQLALRPAIDEFFDEVLVMDEDPQVRSTRLAILRKVHALFLDAWDLSKIALETSANSRPG